MNQLPEKCKDPAYNGRNLTNRVLIEKLFDSSPQKRVTYYCPAYLRLNVQNFSQMNFEQLSASINSVLQLTVNFRGLCPALEKKIRPLLKLGFNRDDSLQIKQSSKSKAISTHVEEGGIYTYTIYKVVHVAMKPDIKWFPVNLVHLIMSVYLKDIQLNDDMLKEVIDDLHITIKKQWVEVYELSKRKEQLLAEKKKEQLLIGAVDNKIESVMKIIQTLEEQLEQIKTASNINIKFNFMDSDILYLKMTPPAQSVFGSYQLALAKMNVEYTNIPSSKRVRPKLKATNKKQKSLFLINTDEKMQLDYSKIKPFNYAHFQVPVYKVPDVAILTIFFPLWLLAILTLGIYFQDNGLADRIISLSSLMIAFVSLIPVIRQQLPQSPNLTLVEFIVYAQILTGLLCFGESIEVRNFQDHIFIWYENGFFLVSLIITCIQILVIIGLWLFHGCIRVKQFKRIVFLQTNADFKYKKWSNEICDRHFRRKIDNSRIKVLEVNKQVQYLKQEQRKMEEIEKEKHEKQESNVQELIEGQISKQKQGQYKGLWDKYCQRREKIIESPEIIC